MKGVSKNKGKQTNKQNSWAPVHERPSVPCPEKENIARIRKLKN